MKHFVYELWGNNVTSNVDVALTYLQHSREEISRFNFEEFKVMYQKCPQVFYPAFHFQQQIMRKTFGITWWEWKKQNIKETADDRKSAEIALMRKKQNEDEEAENKEMDELLKKRMGMKYYLQPWTRAEYRARIKKAILMSTEIDEILAEKGPSPAANREVDPVAISNIRSHGVMQTNAVAYPL